MIPDDISGIQVVATEVLKYIGLDEMQEYINNFVDCSKYFIELNGCYSC